MESELTNINSIGLGFTMLMGLLLLLIPRKYAVIPIIMTGAFITLGQMMLVLNMHFTMMRVIILIGWIRLILRHEITSIKLKGIDKAVIYFVISGFIIYNIREQNADAFINRLGFAYNAIGLYFLFRFLIRDYDDIKRVIKALAVLMLPLAIMMIIEKATGRNLFSIFGGVAEYSMIREGKLRCSGPFAHPILAGTFGAVMMPLFIGLWQTKEAKILCWVGFLSGMTIVISSASSGPALSLLAGILALCFWPLRNQMSIVRWTIVILLVSLHLVMKAPVWYLIAKVTEITGGTGWHRSELINQAINHINEWWLMGTNYTAHWMPYTNTANPDSADITNQYIYEGVNGGILTVILFVLIIARGFRQIGLTLKLFSDNSSVKKILVWSIGAALFVHIMSFISVVYFDQMIIFWYLQLAMIAALPTKKEESQINILK
jgi:hypothetical protein